MASARDAIGDLEHAGIPTQGISMVGQWPSQSWTPRRIGISLWPLLVGAMILGFVGTTVGLLFSTEPRIWLLWGAVGSVIGALIAVVVVATEGPDLTDTWRSPIAGVALGQVTVTVDLDRSESRDAAMAILASSLWSTESESQDLGRGDIPGDTRWVTAPARTRNPGYTRITGSGRVVSG